MAWRRIATLQDLDEHGGDFVRVSDCARVLASSTTYIHKLIGAGAIRGWIRVGVHYRIPARELRRLARESRLPPTTTAAPSA